MLHPLTSSPAPVAPHDRHASQPIAGRAARLHRFPAVALLVALTGMAGPAVAEPVVTSVQVDHELNTIRIIGSDLARGSRAVRVTLASVGDITTDCETPPPTDTLITCTLTDGTPPAGDYLVTIVAGDGSVHAAAYALTVGAVGQQGSKGDTGATGAIGPQGPRGDTGVAGPVGPKGDTGAVGPVGPKGETGATGSIGPQGPQGPAGATGPQGVEGPAGPQGPAGPAGPGTANISCGGFGAIFGFTSEAVAMCRCVGHRFTITATADVTGVLQSWPGGQQTFGDASCGGSVSLPSGRIDALDSHTGWNSGSFRGFSFCRAEPQFPTCNSVAGIPGLSGTFPRCSSALGGTASTAQYIITCG